MNKIIINLVILFFLFPGFVIANNLPEFFRHITQENFFPNEYKTWKLTKNIKQDNLFFLEWQDPEKNHISLKYRNATTNTIQGIYKSMAAELDIQIKQNGGNIIAATEYFALVAINDTQWKSSVNLLYGTTEGAYLWKYKIPNAFKADMDGYIASISSVPTFS